MSIWYRPKNEPELTQHILSGTPSLYLQSKTSTVISYNGIEEYAKNQKLTLVDLSQLKSLLEWKEDFSIRVKGATNWQDMRNFALSKGRRIMTSPTEELAGVLAGLATSCTGEHSFGYGTLRDLVMSCRFINYRGEKVLLDKKNSIETLGIDSELLQKYRNSYKNFEKFKNGPFPRLENATDLMIGSEGQLGVITEAIIQTAPLEPTDYYFILVPRWEQDYSAHLEIFNKVQDFRGKILTVELIDWNSLAYLPKTEWTQKKDHDVIFMEVLCKNSEEVFESLLAQLETIDMDNIFSFDETKFTRLRKSVPRFVSEINSRKGVIKKGTDVQISPQNFDKLFDCYRSFAKLGIAYNLFGHFGDAHLHFNFLPEAHQTKICDEKLIQFYHDLTTMHSSPFAEHGIGLIKQKFIAEFWNPEIVEMFEHLKNKFDPQGVFFPQGYMSKKN